MCSGRIARGKRTTLGSGNSGTDSVAAGLSESLSELSDIRRDSRPAIGPRSPRRRLQLALGAQPVIHLAAALWRLRNLISALGDHLVGDRATPRPLLLAGSSILRRPRALPGDRRVPHRALGGG